MDEAKEKERFEAYYFDSSYSKDARRIMRASTSYISAIDAWLAAKKQAEEGNGRLDESLHEANVNRIRAMDELDQERENVRKLVKLLQIYRESHNTCIKDSPQGLCNKCRIAERILKEVEGR